MGWFESQVYVEPPEADFLPVPQGDYCITKYWEGVDPVRWKTRDGRKMKIEEMGDAHLRNAIKAIQKKEATSPDQLFVFRCLCQEMAFRGLTLP